jgi:hypothetical protein
MSMEGRTDTRSAPPYSEQPFDNDAPPPPYAPRATGPEPGAELLPNQKDDDRAGSRPSASTTCAAAGPSSAATGPVCAEASSPSRTDTSPFAFVKNMAQSYEEKKKAKEAARKVDFYQDIYGFVPKNAMTEAEWKLARKRAPKTKVDSSLHASVYGAPSMNTHRPARR